MYCCLFVFDKNTIECGLVGGEIGLLYCPPSSGTSAPSDQLSDNYAPVTFVQAAVRLLPFYHRLEDTIECGLPGSKIGLLCYRPQLAHLNLVIN